MSSKVVVDGFEETAEEWERLLALCWTNSVFLTPGWQRIWWRNFGADSEQLILSVRDDGVTLGIAPLMRRHGIVTFIGDTDLFDYHDFIVPRGNETRFYQALCEDLMNMQWDSLDLRSVPQGSPTLRLLPAIMERMGLAVEVEEEDVAPVAPLPETWTDYLDGLPKKDRHELRRKLRRLDAADTAVQSRCESPELHDGCMTDFFRLMRASSVEKAEFLTPARAGFFNDIATDLGPAGTFKLYFLEVAGVRVASCICFDHSGTYFLYNSGYDPEYSQLSVGLLNKALCIREAIEEGRQDFHFLRGPERYKYNLGAHDRFIYRLVVRR